ncbi:MAG: acyl carrier protein [Deltaproteobacteria bacterium]|nr:acyl carrier protein [Deltaproteobacteria bacterium]
MSYLDTVRQFIIENFLFGEESKLEDDMSFLENGIIDSTGILELIAFLEETYNIKVEDEELIPENLDSLSNAAAFIETKMRQQDVACSSGQ